MANRQEVINHLLPLQNQRIDPSVPDKNNNSTPCGRHPNQVLRFLQRASRDMTQQGDIMNKKAGLSARWVLVLCSRGISECLNPLPMTRIITYEHYLLPILQSQT